MDARVAKCVLLTKVLTADGIMTENERVLLDKTMAREGLSELERKTVADLDGWAVAEATLSKLPEAERRELLGHLVEAASADGRLSPLEASTLKQITAALGL